MNCPQGHTNSMSYVATRAGGRKIYRCGICGAEIMKVDSNSHAHYAGTYITDGTLKQIDRERRG